MARRRYETPTNSCRYQTLAPLQPHTDRSTGWYPHMPFASHPTPLAVPSRVTPPNLHPR